MSCSKSPTKCIKGISNKNKRAAIDRVLKCSVQYRNVIINVFDTR